MKLGDAKIAAGALFPHEIIRSLKRGSGAPFMSGTPMEVPVTHELLASELSAEPWKGRVITFSLSPELHSIKEGDHRQTITRILRGDVDPNSFSDLITTLFYT
ncbi:hypothetical protein L6452_02945 [Arctium lappa]|uniref:Uncharacterized protein n=1 Tax=Arctium lappa TaxID=4217 RepID=A0ACB9FMG1_ARCLA|nr:hypothetical protein L6452_02945 [Arctium lappa]